MQKRIRLFCFKPLGWDRFKSIKAVTLIELMISIMVVAIMVLSFFSLQSFSSRQVMNADRRSKVQNSLSSCLDHMSKYVQQATGDKTTLPIQMLANGFKVDYDCKRTPSNLADDVWISYTLTGHNLSVVCTGANCGTGALPEDPCKAVSTTSEVLSTRIASNFSDVSPSALPSPLVNGFTISRATLGNFIDIGLVGLYDPTQAKSTGAVGFQNPQVEMKTKIICNSASSA